MGRNRVDAPVNEDVRRVMFPIDIKAGDETYAISALLPGVDAESWKDPLGRIPSSYRAI